MGRRALLLLWILAAACGKPPPPPPAPPPPTPQQRLDAAKPRLLALAEQQLASAPSDAHLRLWVAALKGVDDLPPGPLGAALRASSTLTDEAVRALEEAAPASSYPPLFRARLALRARVPDAWAATTAAVQEAVKRNQWDCPVRAFRAWALGWLESNEPDAFVRVCFRPRHASAAADAFLELVAPVEGAAFAPPEPRNEGYRLADVLQKLLDGRIESPQASEALAAHAALKRFLPAKMLLAWRRGTLPPAQEAGGALEAWGRRDVVALAASLKAREENDVRELFARGALVSPFGPAAAPAADLDPEWKKEALREVQAKAKVFFARDRADATRTVAFFTDARQGVAGKTSYENQLGQALRDRDFIGTDAFPKDRWEQLLDVAFPRDEAPQSLGQDAYGWIVRDNLRRPKTLPSSAVERRFAKKDEPRDRSVQDLDVYAVLKARKEAVGDDRRPAPAAVRKASEMRAGALHGYGLVLAELAKTAPAQAVEWLPEPGGAAPSSGEVLIAEALRGATGKDLGPDWAAWKAALAAGR